MAGTGTSKVTRRCAAMVAALLLTVAPATIAGADQRPFGDARILAGVPTPPGFPEGIAVRGNATYVSGPATFGTAGGPPSAVLLYETFTGRLIRNYPTRGEDLSQEHANSNIALDRAGTVYVLNTQLGIYRLLPGGSQQPYASPFPDLPPCGAVPPGTPCSPTPFDAPPLPNDIVFDEVGNAYVTDSFQATIWRVLPGGGVPRIWFQDPRLASPTFGPNGIRLSPDRTKVFFTMSEDFQGRAFVYTLPLVPNPANAALRVFHEYTGDDLPDGIAFGQSGRLYVTIATPFASGLSILTPGGREAVRLTNQGNPIFPYDSPAGVAFNGRGSALLVNHAFVTGVTDPGQFTVLDVWVNDTGSPLALPIIR